jgi:hypothetical protein
LHDWGPDSVERLKESGFLKKFGINLMQRAIDLWEESNALFRS